MVDRETFVQVAPWLAIAGNALLTPPLQAGVQSAAIFDACLWEELAACGDAEVAKKKFASYKKCTRLYLAAYAKHRSIDKLAVNA